MGLGKAGEGCGGDGHDKEGGEEEGHLEIEQRTDSGDGEESCLAKTGHGLVVVAVGQGPMDQC